MKTNTTSLFLILISLFISSCTNDMSEEIGNEPRKVLQAHPVLDYIRELGYTDFGYDGFDA